MTYIPNNWLLYNAALAGAQQAFQQGRNIVDQSSDAAQALVQASAVAIAQYVDTAIPYNSFISQAGGATLAAYSAGGVLFTSAYTQILYACVFSAVVGQDPSWDLEDEDNFPPADLITAIVDCFNSGVASIYTGG